SSTSAPTSDRRRRAGRRPAAERPQPDASPPRSARWLPARRRASPTARDVPVRMQPAFDVAVVGGGLVGAALAYELVSAGASVVLIDRHDPGRATDAGAGILSPESIGVEDPAWFGLAMAAGDHYRQLVPALEE